MTHPILYIANVGANASHRSLSPLYDDGYFDLITIPEQGQLGSACLRYKDLRWHDPRAVRMILGRTRWEAATHNDPDLWDGVYGDVPYLSSRAAPLRRARPGDALLFFARLRPFGGNTFHRDSAFYFVGGWSIHKAIDVKPNIGLRLERRVSDNPHVRKYLAGSPQRFSLFLSRESPTRLTPPVRMSRSYLRRALPESRLWKWVDDRTRLQTIGSYLRTIKAVSSEDHPDLFELLEPAG